jgi:pyridoxine 5-phosphate synthase
MKLSFLLDPVTAYREVRRSTEPSPAAAALAAANAGAFAVTAHLRGDRLGIREDDLDLLQKGVGLPFFLDLAPTREVVKTSLLYSPEAVTLVPDRWEDSATEGGIDVALTGSILEPTVKELRSHGVTVFLFVDPDLAQIRAAHRVNASGVRLSTRPYSLSPTRDAVEALSTAAQAARKVRLSVHAGGELTYRNISGIAKLEEIEMVHVGTSIAARALFVGLDRAIRDFDTLLR